jgi:cytochrome c-type biogenesis protein CcmH
MSSFWTASLFWAFVLVSVGVALGAVLPPLLRREADAGTVHRRAANIAIYRDQLAELKADLERGEIGVQQYEDARLEIEKRLSEDVPAAQPATDAVPPGRAGRWAGFTLAGVIPVAAIGLYVGLGNPDALSPQHAEVAAVPGGQHDAAPMLASLEAKLKRNPDNAAGWIMLGRSYETLDRPADAARAFAKAVELLPGEGDVLADYAEALALAQGKVLAGKPLEYVNKALQLSPTSQKALELAAIAAEQTRNFAQAASYWRKLLKVIPPDSDYAQEITAAAEQAERAAASLPD